MGIAEDLQIAEVQLKELITRYEQYFLGLEKREPLKLLEEFERLVRRYANTSINNTMYKHRYNNLVARFNSYRQHWNRILREIEEGRYSRDRFRADLRAAQRSAPVSPDRERPDRSGDRELDRIFNELIEARRSCNLPTDSMDRTQLAATLERQRPQLMQKLGTDEISFRVVVEAGKPKIKAGIKPKKTYE